MKDKKKCDGCGSQVKLKKYEDQNFCKYCMVSYITTSSNELKPLVDTMSAMFNVLEKSLKKSIYKEVDTAVSRIKYPAGFKTGIVS